MELSERRQELSARVSHTADQAEMAIQFNKL